MIKDGGCLVPEFSVPKRAKVKTPDPNREGAALWGVAVVVLSAVALGGFVLSYASLYQAASPIFGAQLALGFPVLVDLLVLGASAAYAAGAMRGRPRLGWRTTAHAAAASTVFLNALAAPSSAEVPWHIAAPLSWSILVELTGAELLGRWRSEHGTASSKIAGRLWLTAPIESARTWLLMARTGAEQHTNARVEVGLHAAARHLMKMSVPRSPGRSAGLRVVRRQLRAGSLDPATVLAVLESSPTLTAEQLLRRTLISVLQDPPRLPRPLEVLPAGPVPGAGPVPSAGPVDGVGAGPVSSAGPVPSAGPVDGLLAEESKVGQAKAALLQVDGDAGAALTLLARSGSSVSRSLMYSTRRQLLTTYRSVVTATGGDPVQVEAALTATGEVMVPALLRQVLVEQEGQAPAA